MALLTEDDRMVDSRVGYPPGYEKLCRHAAFRGGQITPYSKGPPQQFLPYEISPEEKKRVQELENLFPLVPVENRGEINTARFRDELWQLLPHLEAAGFDPAKFRADAYGNVLHWDADEASPLGWAVDHWFPRCRGGMTVVGNLRIIQRMANARKKDRLECLVPYWELQAGISVDLFLATFASSNLGFRSRAHTFFFGSPELAPSHRFPSAFIGHKLQVGRAAAALGNVPLPAVPVPPPTPASSTKSTSRVRQKWTKEEEEALIRGLSRHGKGAWKKIQETERALSTKNPMQCKDKWVNLCKTGRLLPCDYETEAQLDSSPFESSLESLEDELSEKEAREQENLERLQRQEEELKSVQEMTLEKAKALEAQEQELGQLRVALQQQRERKAAQEQMLEKLARRLRDTLRQTQEEQELAELDKAACADLQAQLQAAQLALDSARREALASHKRRSAMQAIVTDRVAGAAETGDGDSVGPAAAIDWETSGDTKTENAEDDVVFVKEVQKGVVWEASMENAISTEKEKDREEKGRVEKRISEEFEPSIAAEDGSKQVQIIDVQGGERLDGEERDREPHCGNKSNDGSAVKTSPSADLDDDDWSTGAPEPEEIADSGDMEGSDLQSYPISQDSSVQRVETAAAKALSTQPPSERSANGNVVPRPLGAAGPIAAAVAAAMKSLKTPQPVRNKLPSPAPASPIPVAHLNGFEPTEDDWDTNDWGEEGGQGASWHSVVKSVVPTGSGASAAVAQSPRRASASWQGANGLQKQGERSPTASRRCGKGQSAPSPLGMAAPPVADTWHGDKAGVRKLPQLESGTVAALLRREEDSSSVSRREGEAASRSESPLDGSDVSTEAADGGRNTNPFLKKSFGVRARAPHLPPLRIPHVDAAAVLEDDVFVSDNEESPGTGVVDEGQTGEREGSEGGESVKEDEVSMVKNREPEVLLGGAQPRPHDRLLAHILMSSRPRASDSCDEKRMGESPESPQKARDAQALPAGGKGPSTAMSSLRSKSSSPLRGQGEGARSPLSVLPVNSMSGDLALAKGGGSADFRAYRSWQVQHPGSSPGIVLSPLGAGDRKTPHGQGSTGSENCWTARKQPEGVLGGTENCATPREKTGSRGEQRAGQVALLGLAMTAGSAAGANVLRDAVHPANGTKAEERMAQEDRESPGQSLGMDQAVPAGVLELSQATNGPTAPARACPKQSSITSEEMENLPPTSSEEKVVLKKFSDGEITGRDKFLLGSMPRNNNVLQHALVELLANPQHTPPPSTPRSRAGQNFSPLPGPSAPPPTPASPGVALAAFASPAPSVRAGLNFSPLPGPSAPPPSPAGQQALSIPISPGMIANELESIVEAPNSDQWEAPKAYPETPNGPPPTPECPPLHYSTVPTPSRLSSRLESHIVSQQQGGGYATPPPPIGRMSPFPPSPATPGLPRFVPQQIPGAPPPTPSTPLLTSLGIPPASPAPPPPAPPSTPAYTPLSSLMANPRLRSAVVIPDLNCTPPPISPSTPNRLLLSSPADHLIASHPTSSLRATGSVRNEPTTPPKRQSSNHSRSPSQLLSQAANRLQEHEISGQPEAARWTAAQSLERAASPTRLFKALQREREKHDRAEELSRGGAGADSSEESPSSAPPDKRIGPGANGVKHARVKSSPDLMLQLSAPPSESDPQPPSPVLSLGHIRLRRSATSVQGRRTEEDATAGPQGTRGQAGHYQTQKSPTKGQAGRSPYRDGPPSQSPTRNTPAQSPMRDRPGHSPIRERPAKSPARSQPAQSPIRDRLAQSPFRDRRPSKSPIRHRPDQFDSAGVDSVRLSQYQRAQDGVDRFRSPTRSGYSQDWNGPYAAANGRMPDERGWEGEWAGRQHQRSGRTYWQPLGGGQVADADEYEEEAQSMSSRCHPDLIREWEGPHTPRSMLEVRFTSEGSSSCGGDSDFLSDPGVGNFLEPTHGGSRPYPQTHHSRHHHVSSQGYDPARELSPIRSRHLPHPPSSRRQGPGYPFPMGQEDLPPGRSGSDSRRRLRAAKGQPHGGQIAESSLADTFDQWKAARSRMIHGGRGEGSEEGGHHPRKWTGERSPSPSPLRHDQQNPQGGDSGRRKVETVKMSMDSFGSLPARLVSTGGDPGFGDSDVERAPEMLLVAKPARKYYNKSGLHTVETNSAVVETDLAGARQSGAKPGEGRQVLPGAGQEDDLGSEGRGSWDPTVALVVYEGGSHRKSSHEDEDGERANVPSSKVKGTLRRNECSAGRGLDSKGRRRVDAATSAEAKNSVRKSFYTAAFDPFHRSGQTLHP